MLFTRTIILIAISLGPVLSKSRRHDSGFRGNKNVGIDQVCDFTQFCKDHGGNLHEQMHCGLEGILKNKSNFTGTITFFSNGTQSSLEVFESSEPYRLSGVNSLITRTVEETLNNTISDLLIGNGSLFDINIEQDYKIGNDSTNSFILDPNFELFGDIDELSIAYDDFEAAGIGEIIYNSSNLDDVTSNSLDDNITNINGDIILDELFIQDFNSTLITLEEIAEKIPDLRELYKLVRKEKQNVSIRDLLKVSTKLMRSLYSTSGSEIDDSNLEKLKERLSESEIENLKAQDIKLNNSTKPWYEPLKKFGINIFTNKSPIFTLIISVVESVVGISPIGSIINVIVRVIAAILTLIYDLIQKRKSNSNLVRALRSLDSFDASPSSKISLANKLIERISENAYEIEKSQNHLRSLYKDLSGLAHNADQELFTLEDQILREKLNNILNSTLISISSSNLLDHPQSNIKDSLLIKTNYVPRLLADIGSVSVSSLFSGYGFRKLATDIESYLDESYNLAWDGLKVVRTLTGNDTIDLNTANMTVDIEMSSNSSNSTSISTKPKWYDGLIQFSKNVVGLSGITSMLDMLLELFSVIFMNSPHAESILSVLKLVVYLIKSVFNIFGNIASSRKLIDITRIIPERLANDRDLLRQTLEKIQNNMDSIEKERILINSQITSILEIPFVNMDHVELDHENVSISREYMLEAARSYLADERLLLSSETTSMSAEINFKTWIEKVGSFLDNSYEKVKSVIRSIFETIFKGNKIVAFIDKLIDLIISVVRSIYHAFKNKSTQRLLIMSIENCDEPEIQEILYEYLERTLINEDSPVMKLLN